MKPETVIDVKDIQKTYKIWSTPSARIYVPLQRRLSRLFKKGGRFHESLARSAARNCREFIALDNINLKIQKGESIGFLGRNGSGKSTLLQIIAGTLTPTKGSVTVDGKTAALLELGSGFNPEFTGLENVHMNAAILGLSKNQIAAKLDEIAEFADIGDFIEQPVKTYSSGMMVRLAFSVSIATRPDILIIDEALSVGDAAFQRKCFRRIEEVRERGCTFIFVSHDLNAITNLTNRAFLMDFGRVLFEGEPVEAGNRYQQLIFGEQEATAEKNYGDGNADIKNLRIEDENGNRIDQLNSVKYFFFAYDVDFYIDVDEPVVGLRVTNVHGVLLISSNTSLLNKKVGRIRKGQRLRIRWKISLQLSPCFVFFSAGVSYSDEDRFLARRLDSLKVAIEGLYTNVGLLAPIDAGNVSLELER